MEYYEVKGNGFKAQFKIKPGEEEIIERLLKFLYNKSIITYWSLNAMETI